MRSAVRAQRLVVGLAHRLRRALQAAAFTAGLAITSAGSSRCVAPGFFGGGHRERLAHRLGDRARVVDPRVPLGHGLHHLDDVDELVGLLVHARQVDLAGDRHDRRVVEIGVGDAGSQVGRPRAQRGQADPALPVRRP